MCKKTAVLVALKYEPKSTDLAKTLAREEYVEQGIEIPPEAEKILDAEVVAEPEKSALDKLAEKAAGAVPAANPLIQAAMGAAIPECAGCGKNVPPPTASDAEGRAFHSECLAVLKTAEKK